MQDCRSKQMRVSEMYRFWIFEKSAYPIFKLASDTLVWLWPATQKDPYNGY